MVQYTRLRAGIDPQRRIDETALLAKSAPFEIGAYSIPAFRAYGQINPAVFERFVS